jgi:hypothetical protein
MKYSILLVLMLFPVTVQAQFDDAVVQSYANEVFENVQGYIEEYGEIDGIPYVSGRVNEHINFSFVRTMVGMIVVTNNNIVLLNTWQKEKKGIYSYTVIIDRKYVVTLMYHNAGKMIIVYSKLD